MELERHDLFSIPIWRSRVPEMDEHAETLRGWILEHWRQGAFRRHAYGYGYQSPATLYSRPLLEKMPALKVLKAAFRDRVLEILRARTNLTVHLIPEPYAFMAWVLIQTSEEWVSGTWHDHFPATLSGCYYLKMPPTETEGEGALAFQRPGTPDPFVRQVQYIKPAEGDLVIFPSQLVHRPQPCPSAKDLRISINMDCYIHWGHFDEEGRDIDQQDYARRLKDSLDPD